MCCFFKVFMETSVWVGQMLWRDVHDAMLNEVQSAGERRELDAVEREVCGGECELVWLGVGNTHRRCI